MSQTNMGTGIRPDLAKDQYSPPYIFLQDQQTEIQNTNCKNLTISVQKMDVT